MKELEQKVALVSSSTRGIGLACAKALAAQGAAVYLGVRRMDAGQQIADEIIAAGGRAGVVYFDAANEESYSGMVDEVAKKEGRLDILVNNFGATDVKTDLDVVTGDTDDFFRIVNTNLKSVYLPSKAAVPVMAKNGGGCIINIGSVGGLYPDLSRTAYGVSKAAIHFLTKDIAVQYARQGVRCNAVLPGFTLPGPVPEKRPPEPSRPSRGHCRRRGLPGQRPGRLHHRRDFARGRRLWPAHPAVRRLYERGGQGLIQTSRKGPSGPILFAPLPRT